MRCVKPIRRVLKICIVIQVDTGLRWVIKLMVYVVVISSHLSRHYHRVSLAIVANSPRAG